MTADERKATSDAIGEAIANNKRRAGFCGCGAQAVLADTRGTKFCEPCAIAAVTAAENAPTPF